MVIQQLTNTATPLIQRISNSSCLLFSLFIRSVVYLLLQFAWRYFVKFVIISNKNGRKLVH